MARSLTAGALAAAFLSVASAVAAAQGGTVTGTVTGEQGQPLQEAHILVTGMSFTAQTGADGKYMLRNVPAGTVEIRVLRVGYTSTKQSVRVIDGQTATLDFKLTTSVIQLQDVVVTATGEQRRVEVGNAVENISVPQLTANTLVRSLPDVLAARTPGVMVQAGTQTGSGQRIRVRGIASINLNNEPIFIVDGIRMTSSNGSTSFGNGGNNFSRLQDINPEDIENIEIVKGPSAATLYGTDAANGVVMITTKKGRAGSSRWNTWVEGGLLDDRNTYSPNYTLAGLNPATGKLRLLNSDGCTLVAVANGTCVGSDGFKRDLAAGHLGYDSLRVFSPIRTDDVSPLGLGYRNGEGVQVSGGQESIRYFMSASRDDEVGVFKLDDYEKNRWDSLGVTIHPWQIHPNTRLLNGFRGNI
ncbi:MAG TPA: TonB-dependent receptor plug domain-containing protein, partial [Gemmatimonadaceae bacterium]